MWRASAGLRPGGRGGWILGNLGVSSGSGSVGPSTEGCPTLSCGWPRLSCLMGSNIAGTGSLESLDGTLMFYYGKLESVQSSLNPPPHLSLTPPNFSFSLSHLLFSLLILPPHLSLLLCPPRLGFATYLLSIITFIMSVHLGSNLLLLTGILLCLATLTYSILTKNDPPFLVRFPDGALRLNFDYSFYMTGVTGLLTVVLAILVRCVGVIYPRSIATFFHHAIIEDDSIFEVCSWLHYLDRYTSSISFFPYPLSPFPHPPSHSLALPGGKRE